MEQISAGVFAAFSQNSEWDFERRLTDALSPSFPILLEMPADERHALICEQIARARRYGFVTEEDFGIYLIAVLALGPDFDVRYAPPQFVFMSGGYSRDEKRAWLLNWTYDIFATTARAAGAGDRLQPLPR